TSNTDNHLVIAPVIYAQGVPFITTPFDLGETSNHSPALAYFNGFLYIAWTSQGGDFLNIMQLSLPNGFGIEPHYLSGYTVNGSPALGTAGNALYVAWTGQTNNIYVQKVNTAPSIGVPPPVELPEKSNDGPALTDFEGLPVIGWTGQDQQLNAMQLTADA